MRSFMKIHSEVGKFLLIGCLGVLSAAGADTITGTVHNRTTGQASVGDDVVLLPHLGSATQQTRESMARIALEQVERVLRGERPTTAVNEVTSS